MMMGVFQKLQIPVYEHYKVSEVATAYSCAPRYMFTNIWL